MQSSSIYWKYAMKVVTDCIYWNSFLRKSKESRNVYTNRNIWWRTGEKFWSLAATKQWTTLLFTIKEGTKRKCDPERGYQKRVCLRCNLATKICLLTIFVVVNEEQKFLWGIYFSVYCFTHSNYMLSKANDVDLFTSLVPVPILYVVSRFCLSRRKEPSRESSFFCCLNCITTNSFRYLVPGINFGCFIFVLHVLG